jgi:hypothetical protein
MERNKMLFGSMFADSKGGKPSFTVFAPGAIADVGVDANGDLAVTWRNGTGAGTHISDTLDLIVTMLTDIYNDVNANYTMLRGDLMKYFSPEPTCTRMLYEPLKISAMSDELASQLENASLLARVNGFAASDLTASVSASSTTLTTPLAGILNPDVDSKAELDDMPINSRSGIPSDGELMAITALMPIAEQVNGAASSHWNILAHNGSIIMNTWYLSKTGRNQSTDAPTLISVGELLADVHSSVQSTMKNAFVKLGWLASIIAHSPMFIVDDTIPEGYIWDVDYVGVISKTSLSTAITRVVRSLYQVDVPDTRY